MQTANITLDIGGDNGNQITKHGVTAAEIAVLIAIHGEAAVHDIEPTGSIDRSNREELSRLHDTYGRARDGEDHSIVSGLYPGAAARVHEAIEELNLPEGFFKPTSRATAQDPLDHDGDGKKGGSKPRKAKKAAAKDDALPTDNADENPTVGVGTGIDDDSDLDDGTQDMPDGDKLFK